MEQCTDEYLRCHAIFCEDITGYSKPMKGFFRKVQGGQLVPDDDATVVAMQKIKTGEVISVDYKKPRNYKFHKKFMALMQIVFDNQEKYHCMEDVLTEIKLQAGHYEEHISLGGKIIYRPKSIAFAAMDEVEFGEFYNKALDIVLKFFLKESNERELNQMVDQVVGFL